MFKLPYLHNYAAFLPDLSGGLDIVVRLGLPDADGLLCSALQQPVSGHQCSPHAGCAHVHTNIKNLCHEGTSWAECGGRRFIINQVTVQSVDIEQVKQTREKRYY